MSLEVVKQNIASQNKAALVFIPILLALIVSPVVGLQLFQDGGSYLFEIVLIKSAAIRQNRLGAFLIQLPTVFFVKLIARLSSSIDGKVSAIRFVFSLNYALIPLISLGLSWFIVRRRAENLLIWATFIILFINLVNFSWLSELLIALQLSCPLLLSTIALPGTRLFLLLSILLLALILLLHPLANFIFLTLILGTFYLIYKASLNRRFYAQAIALFASAMTIKILLFTLETTAYEKRF